MGFVQTRQLEIPQKPGLRAILYVQEPIPPTSQRLILPVRVLPTMYDTLNSESSRLCTVASKQAKNLVRKVATLSLLFPGERKYSTDFGAGRLLIIRADNVPEKIAWEFAGAVILQTEQILGLRVVSQPDYDQRLYHHTYTRYYDALPLQVVHNPTARGTVLSFAAACKVSGIQFSNSKFGILGMGNLGSRIGRKLLDQGVPQIIIYDKDESRLRSYSRKKGYKVARSRNELCEIGPNALILCAHSGSLSREFARLLSQQPTIRLVGGPEAGLDHDAGAIEILDHSGLDFVPSMLCGAMGLAATLEESLEAPPHLRRLEARFASFLDRVVKEAIASHTQFHHTFQSLVLSESKTKLKKEPAL